MNFVFFFFNDTATTEIYTLSLHDALPISFCGHLLPILGLPFRQVKELQNALQSIRPTLEEILALEHQQLLVDRKSTRLNSSHANISYAVFCLKKKKKNTIIRVTTCVITV